MGRTATSRAGRKRSASRAPNYGSAGRMLRIMAALLRTPRGRDLDALAAELGVSRKTCERYAKVLLNEVPAPDGLPLFELVRSEGRPLLRVRGAAAGLDTNAYQAASVFFALAALRVLDGTVVRDGATDVWETFKARLPEGTRRMLEHVDRKFFYVPFAAKEYRNLDEHMDMLLRAVLRQEELDLEYRRPGGRKTKHRFRPYTVVLYRDALYLLGASSRHDEPIYLAVDRIVSVARSGERFSLPPSYSPARATDGVPGIWSGAPAEVSLRLKGRAAEQIPERRIHRTQTFSRLPGGETLMRMTVRGWQELAWWVLSWGPDVEVLEPPELRAFVRQSVRAAAAQYERSGS